MEFTITARVVIEDADLADYYGEHAGDLYGSLARKQIATGVALNAEDALRDNRYFRYLDAIIPHVKAKATVEVTR